MWVLALTLGLVCAGTLNAQLPTPKECATIRANAVAHPSNTDTLNLVMKCPAEFGPVFSTLLLSDTVLAQDGIFDMVLRLASSSKDPQIFQAALSAFADEAQPRMRRLGAVYILLKYTSVSVSDLNLRALPMTYADEAACALGNGGVASERFGPLPATAKEDAHAAGAMVAAGPGPSTVRFLAHCLMYHIKSPFDSTNYGRVDHEVFVPVQHFEAVPLCGRRIRMRNRSTVAVSIRIVWGDTPAEVEANDQASGYNLRGRVPVGGGPYHETIFTVPSPTATRFLVQQVLNIWGTPPYVILAPLGTLDTSPCS
ncbi:MAG: hypothetical protein KC544_13715 [Gemmatimonadetes bacterium]|nr:hypothetical protein [Gemmatimonadota bacterium]